MQLNTYLNFNGQCEAAFKFYERCLGANIKSMAPFESTPSAEHVPADWRKKIMHAEIAVGNQTLMGSDAMPDQYQKPQGFSVSLHIDKPAEADRIFESLAENGKIQMPIQPTFWAARFGMLVDQFGIPWIINCAAAAAQSN
jgi:PhnB protein